MTIGYFQGDPVELIDAEAHPRTVLRYVLDAIPAWHRKANCRGEPPDVMFPPLGGTYAEARSLCSECDAAACCLAEGLQPENINHGMRAGFTPAERRAMTGTR